MPIVDSASFEAGSGLEDFAFGRAWALSDDLLRRYLHAISSRVLKDPECRPYPDLVTFGFFCRAANTKRLFQLQSDADQRFGWGTTLHIAPSNIPVNFAFSLVMGLLAGNSCIVRLPSRIYPQTERLIEIFDQVGAQPEFADVPKAIAFVQTERDSARLAELVTSVAGLVAWGGNETAAHFRALPKAPRAVEVYFPNRVSSALIDASAYLALDAVAADDLARAFFNDSFLVDQNACSSPGPIFWRGGPDDIAVAQAAFWPRLEALLAKEYDVDPKARIDKLLDVMRITQSASHPVALEQGASDAWRVSEVATHGLTLRFGLFLEIEVARIADIAEHLRPEEQTLCVFGMGAQEVFDDLKPFGCPVDRIVPVGRALDIGLFWDGKDLMSILSRRVELG